MRQLDGLYTLILRLTKSEKRYVRLWSQLQQGERVYWHLYELIQQEGGDDERIRAAFQANYSISQFEAARKHLYAVVLRALRNYRADATLENRLVGQIEEAQILFEKGLPELALSQLRAVADTARTHEKLMLAQWAGQLELNYLMQMEFADESEESIVARHEQVTLQLRHQLFVHQHTSINHLLLFRYFHQGLTRSPADDAQLNDLLLEEHRINGMPHRHSLQSRRLHLHFQAAYFLMTGQYADSLATYQEMNVLFTDRSASDTATGYYLYLIDGILTGLRSVGDYGAVDSFLATLEADKANAPAGFEELLMGHRMGVRLGQGHFAEALELFGGASVAFTGVTALTHGQALLLFYGAVAHLGNGQPGAALRLVNQLLRVPQTSLSRTVYTATRLLELVVLVELGDEDVLPHKIRSVEWKLRSQQRLFEAERLVLTILKRGLQQGWQHLSLRPDLETLQALSGSRYESRLNQLVDFGTWLMAKHRGVSVTTLLG